MAHSNAGKEVAKDFSHGAAFAGYVTEHCPSEMSGGEMSPELFYIEYDDGDEKAMKAEQVNVATALAASRRSDD